MNQAISNETVQARYLRLMNRAMAALTVFAIVASFACAFFMEGGMTVEHVTIYSDTAAATFLFAVSAPFGAVGITWFIMAFKKS